jgi:ankyrin repeat protein
MSYMHALLINTRVCTAGVTTLMLAAHHGLEGVATSLIAKGVDASVQSADSGITALIAAANEGHTGIVKALLEVAKVSPNQADR